MKNNLLFKCFIILSSSILLMGKCKSSGPKTPGPPPGGPPMQVPAAIVYNESDINGTNGNGTVPPGCSINFSQPATYVFRVKYLDNNGDEITYSTITKTQSDVVPLIYPTIYIDIPQYGEYWIDLEVTLNDCSDCCKKSILYNSGWNDLGCSDPNFPAIDEQGRPQFWGESLQGNPTPGSTIQIYIKDMDCVCDC